eukprot:7297512-Pyramimonas_sp.AAC.1
MCREESGTDPRAKRPQLAGKNEGGGSPGRVVPGARTFGSTSGQPRSAASTLYWGVRQQRPGADFLEDGAPTEGGGRRSLADSTRMQEYLEFPREEAKPAMGGICSREYDGSPYERQMGGPRQGYVSRP